MGAARILRLGPGQNDDVDVCTALQLFVRGEENVRLDEDRGREMYGVWRPNAESRAHIRGALEHVPADVEEDEVVTGEEALVGGDERLVLLTYGKHQAFQPRQSRADEQAGG